MKHFLYVAVTLPDRRIYYYAQTPTTMRRGDGSMVNWSADIKHAEHFPDRSYIGPLRALKSLKLLTGARDIEHKWVELQ